MKFQFLTTAAIQGFSKLCLLVLSIVLARFLGAEGYGIYTFAFAVLSVLSVVAQMGMPQYILREVALFRARNKRRELTGTVIRGLSVVLASSTLILTLGMAALLLWSNSHAPSAVTAFTLATMLVLLPLDVLSVMIGNILRGLDRAIKGQLVELGLRPILTLTFVCVVFFSLSSAREPQYAIVAQIVACSLVVVFGLAAIVRSIGWDFALPDKPLFGDLRSSAPSLMHFASHSFAAVLLSQVGILILSVWRPTEEVGFYRVAVQGAMLVSFGLHVANVLLAPRIVTLFSNHDTQRLQRLLTRSTRYVFSAALPLGLLLVFAGEPIVTILFGPAFASSSLPLAILSVGHLVSVGFGSVGTLLLMTGFERQSARLLWVTVTANIALSALLIPFFGMTGAAVGTLSSLILWNALLWRLATRQLALDSSIIGMNIAKTSQAKRQDVTK